MTTRGKIVLTILLLGVVGFGMYRWWDKIAPQTRPQNQSINLAKVKQDLDELKRPPTDIPLLIARTQHRWFSARAFRPSVASAIM